MWRLLWSLLKIKIMWNKIKEYWKNAWIWVWGKTEIDEKAIEAAEELKRRLKNVKQELKDVGSAIKEVNNQLGDVGDAAAGQKRKGRKKNG